MLGDLYGSFFCLSQVDVFILKSIAEIFTSSNAYGYQYPFAEKHREVSSQSVV